MSETNSEAGGIIYNVTTMVATGIAPSWMQWMQDEHIPALMQTGCFTGYKMVRLLEVDESEGLTYAVQYYLKDLLEYDRYLREHSPAFRQESINKWGDKIIAFRSLMEVIN